MISPCDVLIVWILKEAEVLTSLSLSATLLALLHCAHLSSRSEYRWDAQCALDTLATDATLKTYFPHLNVWTLRLVVDINLKSRMNCWGFQLESDLKTL